jgi:hypothetical protein
MEVHIGKSELYVDAQKIVSDINISIPTENNNEILISQQGEKLQTINNVVVPGIVQTDLESITVVSKTDD